MAGLPPTDLDRDDPRRRPADEEAMPDGAFRRPAVAARAATGPWLAIGGAAALGVVVLLFMVSRRGHGAREAEVSAEPPAAISAPAPPPDLALAEAAGRAPAFAVAGPPVQAPVTPQIAPRPILASPPPPSGAAPSSADAAQRRHAPSLVVDLAAAPSGSVSAGTTAPSPAGAEAGRGGGATTGSGSRTGPSLSNDEQFSERIGASEPEHARATLLRNPTSVVPQGTMIPAVLETAMNSDLPGYVRAVVSRDVRGFDGAEVLIPRGSRLVGQYRSGLSQGASRIFVIWTRVLRADGASVQIGSPGGDPLGRAGQEGKVHSHFFRQFASSILLSVIGAEVSNLAAQPNTQIVIGGTATGITSSAAPYTGAGYGAAPYTPGAQGGTTGGTTAFPPTITVMQGAPISIFVARDLDFSAVGPAK